MSRSEATEVREGDVLWTPSAARVERSRLREFLRFLEGERGLRFQSCGELWAWSVRSLPEFWCAVATFFDVRIGGSSEPALTGEMPSARWFPNASVNYAERLLTAPDDLLAIVARSEGGPRRTLTYRELRARGARARAGLRRAGVTKGG